MRIDSRIQDPNRELQTSGDTAPVTSRQVPITSGPEGAKFNQVRSDTVRIGTNDITTSAMLEKPVDVKEAVEKLNNFMQSQRKHVNFSVDENTHSTVIKVFKTETGELIKQYPPEEVLAMAAKIRQSIGWMVDSKA